MTFVVTRDDGSSTPPTATSTTSVADDGSRPAIGREGSVLVEPEGGAPLAIAAAAPPRAYRIVYRLEELEVSSVRLNTDNVTVRRPWESRLETLTGAPPGSDRLSTQVGAFGIRLTTGDDNRSLLHVPPALPPSDVRFASVLDAAIDAGLVERRERRRVAERDCQVFRSGGLVNASVYRPPTDTDYGDSCVDAAGLVLEEVLVVNGAAGFRRVAVSVEEDPVIEASAFATEGTPLDVRAGGGTVRRLKDGSAPPGEVLVLPSPPDGFVHYGRFSVVPPQPENFSQDDPTREAFRRAATVDVWVNGVDVLFLDQGGTLRGEAPFALEEAGRKVDLSPFGEGEVRIGGLGAEVRVLLGGGRYLRMAGTLPPDRLAALARSLQRTEGNTLEFAD